MPNSRMDKQTLVDLNHGILLSNNKEWTTDNDNKAESRKHYTKWRKVDTKRYYYNHL